MNSFDSLTIVYIFQSSAMYVFLYRKSVRTMHYAFVY